MEAETDGVGSQPRQSKPFDMWSWEYKLNGATNHETRLSPYGNGKHRATADALFTACAQGQRNESHMTHRRETELDAVTCNVYFAFN